MRIVEINELSDLETLGPTWEHLLAETPSADFFRTLHWLKVYWKHFGHDHRLRAIVVYDGAQCIGILPLVVRPVRYWMGTFRVLGFPMCWGSFYGCIGADARRIFEGALAHIVATRRDWDYIEMRWLKKAEAAAAELLPAIRTSGIAFWERPDFRIPIADLSSGWDTYWASRSSNLRSVCRRNEKKLAKHGQPVEYLHYRPRGAAHGDANPRWDLYEMVLQVIRRSWQVRNLNNGTLMSHDSYSEYFRDMHMAAVEAGTLDLNLLLVGSRPVAYNYNYHCLGCVSSVQLGYDLEFSSLGVGTVLTQRMIEDCCRRGDHTFDFLPGAFLVKRPWQTSMEQSVRYEHLPFRIGSIEILRAQRWLERRWRALRSSAKPTNKTLY